jgi:flagellar protein FliJ
MADTLFSILIDMAERERDQQSKRLAEATARCQAAKDQLAMLEQYRADYEKRRVERAAKGTTTDGYRNFETFIAKLNAAVNQQKRDLEMWQRRCDDIRAEQHNALRKVRSFETLKTKREHEARLLAARQEQALDDEFAMRAYMSRGQGDAQNRHMH